MHLLVVVVFMCTLSYVVSLVLCLWLVLFIFNQEEIEGISVQLTAFLYRIHEGKTSSYEFHARQSQPTQNIANTN